MTDTFGSLPLPDNTVRFGNADSSGAVPDTPDGMFSLSQAAAQVTDSAEEISAFFSEKAESEEHAALEESSIRDYVPPEVREAQEILDLLEKMAGKETANDLDDRSRRLIDIAGRRGNLSSALKAWDGDPSIQHLILLYSLDVAQKRGAPASAIEWLRDQAERSLDASRSAIRAGINSADQQTAAAGLGLSPAAFRQTYRDAVLGQHALSMTLLLVLERFGNEVVRGIELLKQALGADLMAMHPSREPERLHAILQDLFQLAAIASVLERCSLIAVRLHRFPPLGDLNPVALMKDVVAWTAEPWIISYFVSELIRKYFPDHPPESTGTDEKEQTRRDEERHEQDAERDGSKEQEDQHEDDESAVQVIFLNGVAEILRSLPPKVFPSDEHRLQAVEAVQQVLDTLLLSENE